MASNLISRDALLAEYDRVHVGEPGRARKLIAEAPAVDAVKVVRCRDCALWKRVDEYSGKCPFLIGKNQYTVPYHYCSCGERREEDAVD